jgi:hypothetical protein
MDADVHTSCFSFIIIIIIIVVVVIIIIISIIIIIIITMIITTDTARGAGPALLITLIMNISSASSHARPMLTHFKSTVWREVQHQKYCQGLWKEILGISPGFHANQIRRYLQSITQVEAPLGIQFRLGRQCVITWHLFPQIGTHFRHHSVEIPPVATGAPLCLDVQLLRNCVATTCSSPASPMSHTSQ